MTLQDPNATDRMVGDGMMKRVLDHIMENALK